MFTIEKVTRPDSKKVGYKCKCDFRIRNRLDPKFKDEVYTPPPNLTYTEAKRKAEERRNELEQKYRNSKITDEVITVDYLIRKYIEYRSGYLGLSSKTVSADKARFERISKTFGQIRLEDITTLDVEKWIKSLKDGSDKEKAKYRLTLDLNATLFKGKSKGQVSKESGIPQTTLNAMLNGKNVIYSNARKLACYLQMPINDVFESVNTAKPLAGKTVLHHLSLFNSMINQAVKWGLINENVCKNVNKPKIRKDDTVRCWNKDELNTFMGLIEHEDNINLRTVLILLIQTGMRRSEVLGLSWNDISFEKRTIHIHRTLKYTPEKGKHFGSTKNETSVRTIPLPDKSIQALKQYKEYQDSIKETVGDRWKDCDVLLTSFYFKNLGEPLHPDTVTSWFSKFLDSHVELTKIPLHGLRHTFITQLIYSGMNIINVSRIAGHSSIQTTLNKYTHYIESMNKDYIYSINKLFSSRE